MTVKKVVETKFNLEYTEKEYKALTNIVKEWKDAHPMFQPQPTTGPAYVMSAREKEMADVANEILREGATLR